MKIAVAGKGGSGKTTVSGTMARSFAADGLSVLAIDDDDDPNLSVALGVAEDEAGPPLPDDVVIRHDDRREGAFPYELTSSPRSIVDEHGAPAPDGVTLLKAGTVEAGAGCFGTNHMKARLILSEVEDSDQEVILVDMPNGIEHLGLATARAVDVMAVVVEPHYNSMETARKIQPLAEELAIPSLVVVANKVRSDRDREIVAEYCEDHDLEFVADVPYDDAIRKAERDGAAPVDAVPDGPAVRAIGEFADDLRSTVGRRGTDGATD